jgi:HemY protein
VLDDRAAHGDWAGALAIVESNAAAKLVDKPTANRWHAVLKTAMAQELTDRDAKSALALAQDACVLAPGLVPAAALCGRLTAAHGDYRRASKIIETAYRQTPHPDLAAAYLRMRHGDSAADRLTRARALARLAPFDVESQITVGRAALDARDLNAARSALAPLLAPGAAGGRPTARVCLLMADIEAAAGAEGAEREWLARAARAPRDRAWVAGGVISDRWAPVSPSGALDAFVWRTPEERLSAAEPAPRPSSPAPAERPALVVSPPVKPAEPPALEIAPAPKPEPEPEPTKAETRAVEPPRSQQPRSDSSKSEPARGAATIVLLPSSAPDDPGPHEESERRPGFRLFARE